MQTAPQIPQSRLLLSHLHVQCQQSFKFNCAAQQSLQATNLVHSVGNYMIKIDSNSPTGICNFQKFSGAIYPRNPVISGGQRRKGERRKMGKEGRGENCGLYHFFNPAGAYANSMLHCMSEFTDFTLSVMTKVLEIILNSSNS